MVFRDKVVLVTGSTRSIGKGIALAFANEGAKVVINGTNKKLCSEVAAEIVNSGKEAVSIPGDVSNTEIVKNIYKEIINNFGHIDILVNNAGIIYVEECINTSDLQWDKTMAINCRGIFLCSREAAKYMIEQESGKIINISSALGKSGAAKYTHYCASKFAVIGFTQALAKELAPYRINVNAVCPGIVDTDMFYDELEVFREDMNKSIEELKEMFLKTVPLGRFEKPEDVADLTLFLASEKSSYMTGQSINITGGFEMH